MQWDLPEGISIEDLSQRLVSLLAVDLSADRVLVLYDDQGNHEFQVLSHRKLNAHRVWTGEEVDLTLLRTTVQMGTLQVGKTEGRMALCCPVVCDGRTAMIAYADRPEAEEEFSAEELDRVLDFAELAAKRLPKPKNAAPAPAPVAPPPSATPPPPQAPPAAAASIPAPADSSGYRPAGRSLMGSGLVAGRFAVLQPLMTCRFSTLLYGLDRAVQMPVVLRRLETDGQPDREARLQMLREGRFLSRLQHRNLPRVQEIVEDRGGVYLVLEEFEGATLEQLADQQKEGLSAEMLRRYLDQFLDVLEYLHGQDPPLIHRDLRPDSLLVTPHGVIKLAEFGLARMLESSSDPRQTAFRSQGSPFYAAPEQLLGDRSQKSHDLYSVGAILYRLATGKVPSKSVERMMGSATQPSLVELRPDLPADLAGWIEGLQHADIDHRFATVDAVRQAMTVVPPVVEASPELHAPPIEAEQAAVKITPSGRFTAASPKPPPPPKPPAPKMADKFNVWNFLLGKKKAAPEVVFADDEIVEFKSDLMSGEDVDLSQVMLTMDVGGLIPEAVAKSIQGIPYLLEADGQLLVACKDPTEVHIYDHVNMATQGKYKPKLMRAPATQIDLAIEFYYRRNKYADTSPWNEWLERKSFETEELQVANPMADVAYGVDEITSPIIAAVDKLVKEAISVGASDIHMESYESGLDLRYRIDGELHHIDKISMTEASAMVKRLKVMANMDIAQERVTQGGRISLKIGGQEFDLRVSVVPVPAGESVVMRILKKGSFNLTLNDLGFQKETQEKFDKILSQPYGMILVCGPTGSGKSTTLYASLKQIQRPDRKLLTVEDPIEYQMAGICQVQVNNAPREEEKKVTFARVLREFLRQDPDVILVGEIRDTETAAISVQAALTGHLLLSTIHTNDSVGIVARLMDMDVEPFLIGSTLLGGLAQRLARKICTQCRDEVPVTDELKKIFDKEGMQIPPRMFRGTGCKRCHNSGYRGRVGLYELMEVTPDVRALINRRALEEEIRKAVELTDFRTLYVDGLEKVAQGFVSLEEVQRVCKTI
ncbi:Flp pilus assembly complex ATPase component TadA [bacterium]|nr:Flp pilus assembly complex ATPase component TadA [bacterium]